MGYSILSISLPIALAPGSFRGYPTPCANGVGDSGMSGEPGEAGFAHGGWDGGGVHTDISEDGRGLGGWGQGLEISWGPRQPAG